MRLAKALLVSLGLVGASLPASADDAPYAAYTHMNTAVCNSSNDLEAFMHYMTTQDWSRMNKLITANKCLMVVEGSKVTVLSVNVPVAHVTYEGKKMYAPAFTIQQ